MAERIDFYRSPVDRELLRSLTHRSDVRGLIQSLGILGMYAATTALCLAFFLRQMWIAMGLACYLHAVLMGFLGMEASVHELSHKTPFRSRWLNEFFYGLFAFLTWNNPVHFRESHKRHHQLTVHRGRDKEVVLEPAPFGWMDYLSWFLFDWGKFRMIMAANWTFVRGRDIPDVFHWDPLFAENDPKRARMFLWARLQLLLHLALVVLFLWSGLYVLIFTVTLSYFFATFLSRSCEIVQHIGMRSDVPDWRVTCHTMLFGPIVSFLYWRMNFHIEHHTYAAVPFYNLPRLHGAMAADCPNPVQGHLRGVRKILGLVRRQRREPDWCYVPEMPPGAAPAKMN